MTSCKPSFERCCCPLCGWRRRRYCVRVVSGPARCLHTCWRTYPAHRWPQSQLRAVLRGEPIELGHTYNIVVTADDGTVSRYCKEYGYCALVSARAHLSHAVEVYVTPMGGQADGLILVEVLTRPPRFSQRLTLYA